MTRHVADIAPENAKVAYFSMEIALEGDVPTYSGGLGVLAGDTIRSAADLQLPFVGITLTYNAGYFYQMIAPDGRQVERDIRWDFSVDFEHVDAKVTVDLQDKVLTVGAWQYNVVGRSGHIVPVYLLDTDLPENEPWQRNLTRVLYDASPFQRIVQEMILGMCGIRMLKELGYTEIDTFHMNEGHSAFLIFELLDRYNGDINEVKRHCVFTTHTPVRAGHDQFDYSLVEDVFRGRLPDNVHELAGDEMLNMTTLAMNGSRYINGVAMKHAEISRGMFPDFQIDHITNGIHMSFWLSPYMHTIFDNELGTAWHHDYHSLERALELSNTEVWRAHQKSKLDLLDYEKSHSWVLLDEKLLTIGYARRITEYKRPLLLFSDLERFAKIASGKAQFIFAGKAHPADNQAKSFIKNINDFGDYLWNSYKVRVVFMGNYDMDLSKLMVSGVDVWLNNPRRYREASGTSGMKAALNGVLNFSVLDGWWIEGFKMDPLAGWAIGPGTDDPDAENKDDASDAEDLYNKLQDEIIPIYRKNPDEWRERMKHAIKLVSFFNTHRMVEEYAQKAYKLERQPIWKSLV
ncbi:MAG TPA: alpha-glucan family phosphorylase [Candidatus Lokiarchaeia archaeon]|nr:alpha-glucan family phosphorylase [Candidatus Lokiarchaeia archaeon]